MFVNSIILLLVPSIAKYRTVRQITLVVITVESVLVLTGRFSEQATHWAYALFHGTIPGFEAFLAALFGVLVFGEVVWLSLWRVSKEFYLGGLLAGWALFISAAWFWRFIVHNVNFYHINPIETALFSIMPLYCTAGVLTHWFLRMEHRISYDPLLHIYNRDYCSKIISEQSNLDTAPPFSVAMVDIDHFKNVNDTYGHQAGDQVLYAVAQAIQREVVPDGTVCRYGGEEMIIFFPQRTTKDVEHCVENVRVAIEKMKTKTRKKPLSVTVSCGISTREDLSQSIIDVIHSADKALYRAKNDGRNQVRTSKTPLEQSKKK